MDLTQLVLDGIARGGYLGIFLLMALENIFPPIPSEVIMGVGGINVADGRMDVVPLMLAGTFGSTLGNYAWFLVGRRLGIERLRPFVERWGRWLTLDWKTVEQMNAFFHRHGHWIVFGVRFSPLFRTMISLPAGLARMGHVPFLLYTFAGAAIWNGLLVWAGWHLGTNFRELAKWTGPVVVASLAIVLVVYLWRVFTWRPDPPVQP